MCFTRHLQVEAGKHTEVVPATWEAEAGDLLEPGSLRPAWATQQDSLRNNEVKHGGLLGIPGLER